MLDTDVINPRVCLILPKYWYVLRVFYTFIFLPRSNPIEMNELLTKRYNNDMFRGTFTVLVHVHEVSVWLMIIDSWSRVFYPWKGSLKNIILDTKIKFGEFICYDVLVAFTFSFVVTNSSIHHCVSGS